MSSDPQVEPRNTIRLAVAHLAVATTIFLAGVAAVNYGWVIRGLILMGIAVAYLIYELVTSKAVVKNVPGMFRLLLALFAVVIFLGLNQRTIKGLLNPSPMLTPNTSPTPYHDTSASPTPAPVRHPRVAYVSPPKSAPTPTPSSVVARLGVGPEAYKDISDEQLAVWSKEEADKIEQLAKDSMANSFSSANAKMWRFTQDFQECCEQDLKDLRTEILRRLGPPAKDPDEIQAWTIIFINEKYPFQHAANTISPLLVESYAPYLRRLALRLEHRVRPRVAPEALKFTQAQIQPQQQGFPSTVMVTIETKAPLLSGYIVVDFEGKPAGISCDFKDSDLFYPSDPRVVDNRELTDHLSAMSRGAIIYALKIGKTPFTPDNPVHVFASGVQPFGVTKVTLYHE